MRNLTVVFNGIKNRKKEKSMELKEIVSKGSMKLMNLLARLIKKKKRERGHKLLISEIKK